MEILQELKGWHVEGRSLILDGGWEGKVVVTPALPGVLQVRLWRGMPWSQEAIVPSLSVEPSRWPDLAAPVVDEQADHLLVECAGVTVKVTFKPLRLEYWAPAGAAPASGAPLLAEAAGGGLCFDGWSVGVRFRLDPADRFFGLGTPSQRHGPIPAEHRGKRYSLWHKHMPAPSRLVLPVLVSHRGYGLFFDNPWVAEIDLGADGQTFGYTAQGGQLVYYFIAGPALTDVLDRYTRLTGRPALAPKWTFGLMQSKFGYRTRSEVEALVETFEAKQIPVDTVVLDLYWFKAMGDLSWNKAAFPHPAEMIATLRARGIRVIVIEEPYVVRGSRLFPEMERLGLLGRRPDGSTYTFPFWAGEAALVDFTQPLARQFWADQHQPLMAMGIAGWWTDLNEPEEHPIDMIHQGGIAPAVHNVFCLHMLNALKLAQEQHDPDGRLYIMSRAGWPGAQALGAGQWSGDVSTRWEALSNQIPIGLSMGMSGMAYWNTDIGGFVGDPATPELYCRWMQFGAFTPVMRPHGAHMAREPWAFGEQVEEIVTRFIRLRYRLLPYTYTLAREANSHGLPFMRPIVLHYPADERAPGLADQFLWGRDILVAPVVTPDTVSRKLYLPEGIWYDFWTNRPVSGGRNITAAAPLESMPLYVRAGAIIPMAADRVRTGGAWDELTLAIYPSQAASSFTLYEDDGESMAFERGAFATTTFTCSPSGGTGGGMLVTIGEQEGAFDGQALRRSYRLEVRLPKRPASVTVADAAGNLIARRSLESLAISPSGWWYDSRRRLLHVKLGALAGPAAISITMSVGFSV